MTNRNELRLKNSRALKLSKYILGLVIAGNVLSGCSLYPDLEFQEPKDELLEACIDPATDPNVEPHALPAPRSGSGKATPFTCEGIWNPGSMQTILPVAPSVATRFGAVAGQDGQFYKVMTTKLDPYFVDPLPGLVVLIEPGTAEANKKLWTDYKASSFGPLIESALFPQQLKLNFRTLISNFTFAFLKRTFTEGPKQVYGHVYFVKGDANLKQIFLNTLLKATLIHPKVDLFLIGNGYAGTYLMTRDLDVNSNGNLTGFEWIQWIKTINNMNPPNLMFKIRSIFQTHGWTLKQPLNVTDPTNYSMFDTYTEGFPSAKFYVNWRQNIYPLHRDFLMFDEYYRDPNLDYAKALITASKMMKYDSGGTNLRTQITFPAVQGMGCIYLFNSNPDPTDQGAGRYCKPMFQETLKYPTDITTYNTSRPRLYGTGASP